MMPRASLDLSERHPANDDVAKSTAEQLLGASLEGNGRAILDASAQVFITTEEHSSRETPGRLGAP